VENIKISELEIEIKLLDYLKNINSIDLDMYNNIVNKLLKKEECIKNKKLVT